MWENNSALTLCFVLSIHVMKVQHWKHEIRLNRKGDIPFWFLNSRQFNRYLHWLGLSIITFSHTERFLQFSKWQDLWLYCKRFCKLKSEADFNERKASSSSVWKFSMSFLRFTCLRLVSKYFRHRKYLFVKRQPEISFRWHFQFSICLRFGSSTNLSPAVVRKPGLSQNVFKTWPLWVCKHPLNLFTLNYSKEIQSLPFLSFLYINLLTNTSFFFITLLISILRIPTLKCVK